MTSAEPATLTERAKEILARLVSFDSVSEKPNLPMAEWVRDYLAGHGIEAKLLPAEDGKHANLFATIGSGEKGGIGLSGHMDVVPVTGQPWDTDPFKMVERDGRLYGRGTCDMKGFVACVLAMAPEIKAREAELQTPVHVVLSYDEEVGCTGVKPMIAEFGKALPKPRLVIVGEPTLMTVVDAHKGGSRFLTEVTGKDAHSSKPQLGVGAIRIAGELIAELGRIEARLKERIWDPRFDPPYASITVSAIEGGIAHNIIPPHCSFRWGVRTLPGMDATKIADELQAFAERELLPAMLAVSPECKIETRTVGLLPPFSSGKGSEATTLALKLAGQNETFAVPYGTEASHFEAGGSSTVVIGPGSIEQAHQPNEFVEISELTKCLAFLGKVTDWAAGRRA
ncbi:MAG: acetylornithine deacetylase [Proteobacteria bacterium]|nr:acetylornithine deacetylase [Pseudomonadota bacterium]